MARRLIAHGVGIGFLIPENVADDVQAGRLAWQALADTAARTHSGLYQRTGQTTTVALGMFLQFFEAAANRVDEKMALR